MQNTEKNISQEAYQQFLDEVVNLVQNHRTKAVQAVQSFSNQLYWNIGELIIEKQKEFGWGKSVVEQLSKDLNQQLGDAISWSPRNLWFMRQLVNEYSIVNQIGSDLKFLNQPGSDSSIVKHAASEIEKVKQLISEVPWKHNILIIQKVKDLNARIFYLQTTIKNRYSRAVLLHQIEANAYENYLLQPKQTNFNTALPEHLLEQTEESIKSVYSLDFLDINKPITERNLESSMVDKVKRLMMELGYGFCFIGNQFRLELGNKEYFVDLLFYHRILKCLVAVELKVTEFEPEFVGKLDFYLQLIDEQLKQPDDKPSIGILLVPHKDRVEVEYALRIASKPIGVSKYALSKQLPSEFSGKLPSYDDFRQLLHSSPDQYAIKKNSTKKA
jgi:predicted nuclease of restriction endonuclease-like (RecB) superfamily